MFQRIFRFPILPLLFITFLLVACEPTVTPKPTDPAPEPEHRVRRLIPEVSAGSQASGPPLLTNNDWVDLVTGDVVSTDENGEAELDLASCNGPIYVFMNTSIRTSTCRESQQSSGLGLCGGEGTGYYNVSCSADFIVDTASAQILVTGTSYAVTYLKENGLTLVIALDGTVEVRPVVDLETDELGTAISLKGSEFLYTTPGQASREMDGIPARTPQPIENIGPLVNQFELQRWMARVEARAQEDNLLPESWPLREGEVVFQEEPTQEFPEDQPGLPPTGPVSLTFSNGALEEDAVRAAVIFSINKEAALKNAFPNEETQLFVNLAEGKAEINDNSYNPERSIALLEEAGYLGEFTFVYVLVPLDDSKLFAFAQILRESLLAIEIETELVIYSTFDPEYVEGFQETGRPMISILRDN